MLIGIIDSPSNLIGQNFTRTNKCFNTLRNCSSNECIHWCRSCRKEGNQYSLTGILIFLNSVPIIWYSKAQNTVDIITLWFRFCCMQAAIGMIEALHYKLRMFGTLIDESASVFWINKSKVTNSTLPMVNMFSIITVYYILRTGWSEISRSNSGPW